jgi:beta-glucuronidase
MMRAAIAPTLVACALLTLLAVGRLDAATRVGLEGPWQLRVDPQLEGFRKGWQRAPPPDTETVEVPHTWGVGPHEDHLGTAWYFKAVTLPADFRTKHVELHVGAAFYRAHVFLNGNEVGTHEGGHTSFFFDVTPLLRKDNLIAIEIDDTPARNTIPGWALRLTPTGNVWYDWWPYGGLVRGAWLEVSERALIRRQEIRSTVGAEGATVTCRVFVETFGRAEPLALRAQVFAPSSGRVVAEATGAVMAGAATDTALTLRVPSPELWDIDAPNLYRIETQLVDRAGAVVDAASETFGIRTLEIRDRALYLNGRKVRLSGMTRHEDSPWEGLAETAGTIRRDWDELEALQVTLTRPVHYPQHPEVLDYADRNGILLIPEIPVWQFSAEQLENPTVVSLAKRMLKEMIEQAGNHPSILAWSVCNESDTATPGGRAYVKELRDYVNSIDPGRFVTFADDSLPRIKDGSESASQYSDFVMVNEYFGSWAGPAELLGPTLDRIGAFYPDKMFIISEFGLAGFFEPDAKRGDEHRIRIMREQMKEFARRDWIAGAIFWCYQDYKSHRNLWPGLVTGYVDMGVVDENRQRKPSYDVWREENAPARIHATWTRDPKGLPVGFEATVEGRGPKEIPSYELRGYDATWEVRGADGSVLAHGITHLPTIGPPAAVEGSWAPSPALSLELRLRVFRPTGFLAAESRTFWASSGGMSLEDLRQLHIDPLR